MSQTITTMPVRSRRLYHSMDEQRHHFLACLKHGHVIGPITQAQAEHGHSTGKACPACAVEVVRVSAEQMERAHA